MSTDPLDRPDTPFEGLARLNADLRTAARLLGRREIRGLVDLYYQVQEVRKASFNQALAATPTGDPNQLVAWMGANWKRFEDDIKRALGEVSSSYRAAQWMVSVVGIGP